MLASTQQTRRLPDSSGPQAGAEATVALDFTLTLRYNDRKDRIRQGMAGVGQTQTRSSEDDEASPVRALQVCAYVTEKPRKSPAVDASLRHLLWVCDDDGLMGQGRGEEGAVVMVVVR